MGNYNWTVGHADCLFFPYEMSCLTTICFAAWRRCWYSKCALLVQSVHAWDKATSQNFIPQSPTASGKSKQVTWWFAQSREVLLCSQIAYSMIAAGSLSFFCYFGDPPLVGALFRSIPYVFRILHVTSKISPCYTLGESHLTWNFQNLPMLYPWGKSLKISKISPLQVA